MGIAAGASLSEFIGEPVAVSNSGAFSSKILDGMESRGSHMTPGQDMGAVLGTAAFVGFMREGSELSTIIARFPLEVDTSGVDQNLVGMARLEEQEASAATAVVIGHTNDPAMKDEVAFANIERQEANIAAEQVRKVVAAQAAKPPKMK